MGLLDLFRGSDRNNEIKKMIKNGAVIVDVRSPIEFLGSHIKGSINIPLPEMEYRIKEMKAIAKPIVLCGADKSQCNKAERYLKSKRIDCKNGGEWQRLNNLI